MNNAGVHTEDFKVVIQSSLISSLEAAENCWPCQLTSETRNYVTIFYKNIETSTDTKPKEVVKSHFLKLQKREWIFSPWMPHCLFFFFFFCCVLFYFFSVILAQRNWLSFTIDFLWWQNALLTRCRWVGRYHHYRNKKGTVQWNSV